MWRPLHTRTTLSINFEIWAFRYVRVRVPSACICVYVFYFNLGSFFFILLCAIHVHRDPGKIHFLSKLFSNKTPSSRLKTAGVWLSAIQQLCIHIQRKRKPGKYSIRKLSNNSNSSREWCLCYIFKSKQHPSLGKHIGNESLSLYIFVSIPMVLAFLRFSASSCLSPKILMIFVRSFFICVEGSDNNFFK